jgi:hypothetical protein
MCEKCGKEIKGESLGLGESFFHASCLTCTTCKENLAGLHVSRDQAGNIYCTRDYDRSPVLEEFLKSLWGVREPSTKRVVVPARQATQPYGIGSLELILRLKS